MSETNDQDAGKGRLSLRPAGRLELGRTVDAGSVRQSFSHGRSKVVQVEVRKKRAPVPAPGAQAATAAPGVTAPAPTARGTSPGARPAAPPGPTPRALTATDLAARQRALVEQQRDTARREAERREQEKISVLSAAEDARRREEDARRAAEEEARHLAEEASRTEAEVIAQQAAEATVAAQAAAGPEARGDEQRRRPPTPAPAGTPAAPTETLRLRPGARVADEDDESRPIRRPGGILVPRKPQVAVAKKGTDAGRRAGRIDVQAAIEGEDERVRSLASVRRQR